MNPKYDFKNVEKKWRNRWYEDKIFKAYDESEKENKYILCEFPYPSGSGLHMGHAFSFVGGDIYARFFRMKGYNVLFPMGWDAFGLPAENYAIKMNSIPQKTVKDNNENYKRAMMDLGLSIDWDRELSTTDPEYYKWTQWIFLKLFEKGLAYKEEWPINWCPSCKTGLANEEVVDGKCERCHAQTEKRNISQWIVKITAYADRLLDGLKDTNFIDKVKAAQINWIDRKDWIDITYEIEGADDKLTIATTRPDTIYGVTFIVLAPEHDVVSKIISGKTKIGEDVEKIKKYVKESLNKSELDRKKEVVGRDKTGVFTGLYAINPINKNKIPIWIADFVLSSVGTGAVMGVPGSDIRDFEFASQFSLPIVRVVVGEDGKDGDIEDVSAVIEGNGIMINSDILNGKDINTAKELMMKVLEDKGIGKKTVRYHLHDWIFSRQHYWGEPIPIIHCDKCGYVPVPEDQLPVVLPEVENYKPTDTGESPLAAIDFWVNTTCPKCGGSAKRETDTMPNWAGSDWYFIRYLDADNKEQIASLSKQEKWLPVDMYIGGDEHNTLHLLYSRFIYQFLYDLGYVPTPEPYNGRMSHGVILGPDNQRMSKSRGNVITPDDPMKKVGVDALRTYLAFMGPFDGTMAWNENSLRGTYKFINRVYDFISKNINNFGKEDSPEVYKKINKVIEYADKGIEAFQYNTVIAKYMEFMNFVEKLEPSMISKETIEKFVKLISPFMPYLSEELWSMLGNEYTVSLQKWPDYDQKAIVEQMVEIPIQINGKVRGKINIPTHSTQEDAQKIMYCNDAISSILENKTIKKFVYIQGKIISIVI